MIKLSSYVYFIVLPHSAPPSTVLTQPNLILSLFSHTQSSLPEFPINQCLLIDPYIIVFGNFGGLLYQFAISFG